MIYRKRHILAIHILLTVLLAGSSTTLYADGGGVVIKGSVFGGGNEGEVQDQSEVIIESGTIEKNVFGGGNNADVLKNVSVTMSAGTVQGNIYGGGNLGDIGTIDKTNLRAYAWTGTDGNPNSAATPYAETNTGVTHVSITGGTVGIDAALSVDHGNVFGGGKGYDETFWCEKGMVYSADVRVTNIKQYGSVYGGGELGRVETNTAVTIGPESGTDATEITGCVFGAGKGVETHGYSALVRGNTDVIVRNGAKVDQNVYGGGEIASVGKYNVDSNGMPYSLANNGSGMCSVNIPGSTQILGDIFGGGKGVTPLAAYLATDDYTSMEDEDKPKRMTLDGEGQSIWQEYTKREDYFIYLQTLALATETNVTIDPGNESVVQSTKGNVFGGSENGIVQHNTLVTVQGKCLIGEGDGNGNIYGGGKGLENVEGAGQVNGDATVNINSGTLLGSVYGGGVLGATRGDVTVNINGGTVNHDVYGGGAYANTNTSNWTEYVEVPNLTVGSSSVTDYYEESFGGIFSKTKDTVAKKDKKYYQHTSATWADSEKKSANSTTHVNLRGGTILGDAYGGALGDGSHAPSVYGDILVDLNGTTSSDGLTGTNIGTSGRGCVVTNVFGCNNAYGSPQGNVTVHVYGTQNRDASKTNIGAKFEKNTNKFDVAAVYGGGNKAAYNPVDPATNKTRVIIEGCDYTSIDYVYGGGNAAPVPSTDVTVNSAYEINYLFGGGNGKSTATFDNPGADVGIHDDTNYGTGIAKTTLLGGEIHVVYGGSNEKGNIVGGTSIEVNDAGTCTLKVGQIYGAGNDAKMDGGTDIVMGCMPAGVIEEIYAGARNADVSGDVKLTLTSGKFGRVFGGNKHGGKLKGSITVNIEETGDCSEPLIIGELYGGGNLADYSVYGYDATTGAVLESGTKLYNDPKLNVHAFTSIGAIYGGGYRAKMVANPTVDINVAKGSHATGTHASTAHAAGSIANIPLQKKNDSGVIVDDGTTTLHYPAHEAGKIGTIGNVFGGGNLAEIKGNATVNIGTATKIYFKTEPAHLGASAYTQMTSGDYAGLYEVTVEGANIKGVDNTNLKGSVYGGGNEANITGNTQVNICAKYDDTASEYRRVAPGTAGVTIDLDVFGAGKGDNTPTTALVSGNTTIVMMGGEVKQSVYGGGELSQVGGNTYITVKGGTIGKEMEGSTRYGGEIYGNIYGGGKGNTTNVRSGLIKGNTNITVDRLVATAANAEYYGVSEGTVVCSPTILHNIYGGGAHGSVGTYTYASDAAGAAISEFPAFEGDEPPTGVATINILGGTIGYDGHNNGMVFGSSRGDIDAPNTIHDNVAWVYDTHVNIGDATSAPRIWGSVYGSGENGHTYHDAEVTISSGTIGDPDNYFENRGNVYGAGCGTDKYYSSTVPTGHTAHDGEGDKYNHLAGIVQGDATVTINGGSIANNVYGAGSMGKVGGSTYVTINTDGSVGVDGTHDDGNVYGAARGELKLDTDYDYSSVLNTTVNIKKGTIKGYVFGGGRAGKVKGSVAVNVTGGTVIKDVYGGGALADTNTDNWVNNALTADGYHEVTGLTTSSFVQGLYTKSGEVYTEVTDKDALADGSTTYYRKGTTYNTTLNLTGGIIGNAYGGGLGQKNGIDGATSDIEANVYGDVSVMVDGTAFTAEDKTYTEYWYKPAPESAYTKKVLEKPLSVPVTGRVFGCNNINGTPKGSVRVSVRRTKRYDAVSQQVVDGHETGKYEIRGVYGGGNLSHYDPATGKKTSVDIHNCAETCIEKVYGGGNSANVPTTDVTIYGCFDIHYVFGGGNGADVIYRNNRWEENDGANVTGNASVILKGGTISDAFIGSDTKGIVGNNATGQVVSSDGGDCTLKVTNFYGSSKRSDVYGDVYITVSACSESQVENVYGGSYDAQIHGNITMNITSGILKNVFGGNDRLGSIGGDITINIEEADACKPIIIHNLYGGGYNAPYPGETAQRITNDKDPVTGYYVGAERSGDVYTGKGFTYADVTSGNITINVRSCTRIDNIYGGGKGANAIVTGNTRVNVNMAKGAWAHNVLPVLTGYTGDAVPNVQSGEGYKTKDFAPGESVSGYYKLTHSDNTYSFTNTGSDETAVAGITYYEKVANSTNVIKNDIGTIGSIFGGGDEGNVYGNTSIYIAAQDTVKQLVYDPNIGETYKYAKQVFNVLGAHITGNVYGGGNLADVVNGNTKVYIGTADGTTGVAEGTSGVTIAGNVFGGGKGNAQLFSCEKAMVGKDGDGYNLSKGNTEVVIGAGTVGGSVYGGGEIARVENNTSVTVGLGAGNSGTHSPIITGNVFGAGKGIKTHGYSALVRGKSSVTIGGDAWVQKSVYGGGEISTVGRFWVKGAVYSETPPTAPEGTPDGMPYQLKDTDTAHKSGTCEVTIQGYAEIGPNDMEMPTFTGHVFGAGKGFLPESHTYAGADKPQRMQPGNSWDTFDSESEYITFVETLGMAAETNVTIQDHAFVKGSVYGGSENGHVLNNTYVKIQDDCQVGNGWNTSTNTGVNSRYTPAEWAYDVTANDANFLYECNHWPYGENQGTVGKPKWVYLPYDIYNLDNGTPKAASDGHTFYGNVFGGGSGYFPYRTNPDWVKNDAKSTAEGMPVDENGYSNGLWLRSAGAVYGNTQVDIIGGHILTSVYGGNEQTDVGRYLNDSLTPEDGTGTCVVNMVGGTLGVPRTLQQIHDHPVTCYLFGAGKGDQRINFNTWTNVGNTIVNITNNARIYGSTFGGGEDGHVIGDAVTNIGGSIDLNGDNDTADEGETFTGESTLKIGTWGTSYVDGNVFGGGRGFSGEAETAGSVGGNVTVNISNGTMLGSIYGGGRLASVGTYFVKPTLENGKPNPKYGQLEEDENGKTYGHIAVNISGGTIGNTSPAEDGTYSNHNYSGNVYGGCMGRITLLDNTLNPIWPELAQAKTAIVNISQPEGKTTHITGNVYGGGEFGSVRENAWVTIGGKRTTGSYTEEGTITAEGAPTIDGSVFGGGKGSADYEDKTTISVYWGSTENVSKYTYTPMQWAGTVGGNTYVNVKGGAVKKNVYGGGELASVGLINYKSDADGNYSSITKHEDLTKSFALSWPYKFQYVPCNPSETKPRGKAKVTITGGRIGTAGAAEGTTGYVFGGGKGQAMERYTEAFCANVRETEVNIHYETTPDIANAAAATTHFSTASNPGVQAAVYGGGEDGHVIENTALSITGGIIGYSVYAGGKGVNKYSTTLKNWRDNGATTVAADIYSITAGKVYGNTSLTMSGGHVIRDVYGGGYMASVGKGNYAGGTDDYSNFISPKFGSMSGYGETLAGNLWDGVSDDSKAFLNSGKATVTVTGGTVGTVDGIHKGLPTGNVIGGAQGEPAPNIFNMPVHEYNPVFHVGNINEAEVVIGTSGSATGPRLYGSVYGGGRDGHMRRDAKVTIYSGEIGNAYTSANQTAVGTSDLNNLQWQHRGNVYGSGSGIGTFEFDYNGNGSISADQYLDFDGDGDGVEERHYEIDRSFLAGCVARFSEVDIQGGIIHRNVYGGGSVAGTGMPKFYGQDYEPYKKGDTEHGQGYQSMSTVSISGGTIGEATYGGNVFGASRGEAALLAADSRFATAIWTKVDITGGNIYNNVYGGGELGKVNKDTEVNLTGGSIAHDAFGGGKGTTSIAADIGGNTSVELNKGLTGANEGCSLERIFGCNDLNGTPKGHVSVHVYATQHRDKLAIHDTREGKDATYQKYAKYENCSNKTIAEYDTYLRGLATTYSVALPTGYAETIARTEYASLPGDTDEKKQEALEKLKREALDELRGDISDKKYDVIAVYGGGNLAPYEPTSPTELTSVVIDGCELTSIRQVYGGGNAASTPANSLLVNGTYEIDEVFGGGNGKDPYQKENNEGVLKWYQNPGANVGYKDFTELGSETGVDQEHAISQTDKSNALTPEGRKANYAYGSGVATTTVLGGRIHYVYGGSNKRGNICTQALSVYQEAGFCDLDIDDVTGAGKDATTDGEAVLKMDCVSNVKNIYGGSTNADVYNNIVLTITNGTFENVFGGNNTNGAIHGSITVNIEEGGCQPIRIDNLYAGGYKAPYSVYGYEANTSGTTIPKLTGTDPVADPCINVISASYIGNIYGGGYQATVVGNPHVNVNMTKGKVEVIDTGTGEEHVYKDNLGKGTTYTVGVNTESISPEVTYYATVNAIRVEVYKVEGVAPDLDHNGTPDEGYTITEGGKTYVYKNKAGDTYYKVADVTSKTRYWAVLPIGYIDHNIYGGGNQAEIIGDTHVEIGTGTHHVMSDLDTDPDAAPVAWDPARNRADIRGSVFGGGLGADAYIKGNTYVTMGDGATVGYNIYGGGELGSVGPFTTTDHRDYTFPTGKGVCNIEISGGQVGPETPAADKGNVFGGGKGDLSSFYCEKGMVYATNVSIENGTVKGNVYGGGEIGRVEQNTAVTIGLEGNTTNEITIEGDVFGAAKGIETHGYSALVRGNSSVTVQGKAWVKGNVYGGGEVASVGKYNVKQAANTPVGAPDWLPIGMPYTLANSNSGYCTVIIRDNAEIGPDDMVMHNTTTHKPDDKGHVFGAGKGVTPYQEYGGYTVGLGLPWRVNKDGTKDKFNTEAKYLQYLETLALATQTDVTIGGNAFVKGSVYGGSENGLVQKDTHVRIQGDCQIGNGYDTSTNTSVNRPYTAEEWATESLPECSHWVYGRDTTIAEKATKIFYPYDPFGEGEGTNIGCDGHTFYGNVFGGGSGYYPYAKGKWRRTAGAVFGNTVVDITGGHILTSVYGGNEMTDVGTFARDENGDLTLTPVENGKCTVNMTGGTLGVPRTLAQIAAHPVTCYLFGAGKGDQRTNFNMWTNVIETEVNVSGNARIFGSTFGGGEDGHVINNAVTNIGGTVNIDLNGDGDTDDEGEKFTAQSGLKIGTTGTSYVDGNVFGGGRGFSGEALTAGSISGNVTVNISGGTMLGSVYGGGRLAGVGTRFTAVTDPYYGQLQPDPAVYFTQSEIDAAEEGDDAYGKTTEDIKTYAKSHGHITVNISGGTIGNTSLVGTEDGAEHSGNVFGGSMGRLTLLDGSTNPIWPKMAVAKSATTNISGSALITGSVYGGGELSMLRGDSYVTIGGVLGADNTTITSTESDNPVINCNVFGGGYGSNEYTNHIATITAGGFSSDTYTFTPMQLAGIVCGDTHVNIKRGSVKNNIYGGGEMATVGLIDFNNAVAHTSTTDGFGLSWPYEMTFIPYDDSGVSTAIGGTTNVTITGGRIGSSNSTIVGKDNGNIYGGSQGRAGAASDFEFCGNVKQTYVNIMYPTTPKEDNGTDTQLILGSVFGGAEDGHVIEDTHVSMQGGIVAHSLFAGGRGEGTFSGTLKKLTDGTDYAASKIRSLTAGKVYGNTYLEMTGGWVWHNVFGGGYMASVGKGNYSGGADDYATVGYGETITGNLWTPTDGFKPRAAITDSNKPTSMADYFLSSGITYLTITGGKVGTLDDKLWDGLPSGSVFGSSRGVSAPNITDMTKVSPEYCPEFFIGYVNETYMTIGGDYKCIKACVDKNGTVHVPGRTISARQAALFTSDELTENFVRITTTPTIYGSVYGGGQDGHVRREAHMMINKGEVGVPYTTGNQELLGTADLDDPLWLLRGNLFGAGSGLGQYAFDLNGDGDTTDAGETGYSTSAGSVTHFTLIDVFGGTIHRNVYGGGSLASVGPPPVGSTEITPKGSNPALYGNQSQNIINIYSTVGTPFDTTKGWTYNRNYGGEVYGASRGLTTMDSDLYSTSIWTQVNLFNGATIMGNVYGGGDAGVVKKDTEVNIGDEKP